MMPEHKPEVIPEHKPEDMPEDIPEVMPGVCPIRSYGLTDIQTSPVPLQERTEKTDSNGTELGKIRERVRCFDSDLKSQGECVFYDGRYDALTVCLYLTNDYGSIRRWEQLAREKGERHVIAEANTFYHEIKAGEKPTNRGAALNVRLARLPNVKNEGMEA